MNTSAKVDEPMNISDITNKSSFVPRHIGPSDTDIEKMLSYLGYPSMEEFIGYAVPDRIRTKKPLGVGEGMSEAEMIQSLNDIAKKNKVYRSYIGMGYYGTICPPVIARNILENPGWYTQYTPYQPEISQGRLEALLNFQTMVADLTALPIANASLLDEGTAAAEAMVLSHSIASGGTRNKYFISADCYPQTIEVTRTRGEALGFEIVIGEEAAFLQDSNSYFGALFQYPTSKGSIPNYKDVIDRAHAAKVIVTLASDLLSLSLLVPPGELGADIAVGTAQRFGVPLGYGGPHAAFFATKEEYKRQIPGRIVGLSKDTKGRPALRLSLQTREQHIRREKATSNICTAQVLLAVMAGMYAVYHGPSGVKNIAQSVHQKAARFARSITTSQLKLLSPHFFDTVGYRGNPEALEAIQRRAEAKKINLCTFYEGEVLVSFDETVTENDLQTLVAIFTGNPASIVEEMQRDALAAIPSELRRSSEILIHQVFHQYHSETEFLRYIKRLEAKDLSLAQSMIPLGSCTMKLNATSEMVALSWKEFSNIHPFAPREQVRGYEQLFRELERALCQVTGFAKVSLQPNAGSQGEYAGLLVIRNFLRNSGQGDRNVCLIPKSAHGTNPASAIMAGFVVVAVECDAAGNVDLKDLKAKIEQHGSKLACLMITYPSTHGVFEERVKDITRAVHQAGGQVYMDGANLNALVGLVRPSELGMDVCHINLHKTFCIPHGGGGPGMGPIAVAKHLAPFLPSHPVVQVNRDENAIGPISAAPWGSASILTISWAYITAMGSQGLREATEVAILSANYIAKRLADYYPVVYKGKNGHVAHECIIDLRGLKSVGVEVDDVAKRLMDYSFHAPTVSWPVAGTMMVEPTESESLQELDRFCDAMIAIYEESKKIERGEWGRDDNPLKNAPHTADDVIADQWSHPYGREVAAYPIHSLREWKFWPAVGRVDAAYGDRNLICTCPSVEELAEE